MLLELVTPVKWSYDEYNNPYFLKLCEFQNEHVFDQISDVTCIIEVSFDDMEQRNTEILKLRCFDENNMIVIPDIEDETEIRKQITNLIHNKL